MMQFLPCLHILLTCSFVLLLAYVLSTIFSYLASSVIHGGSAKVSKRRMTHAPRNGRPPTIEVNQGLQEDLFMDRLPEEDEEEDDDVYENAEMPAAATSSQAYEFADSIFDNMRIAEEGTGRNEFLRQMNDGIAEEDMEGRGKVNQLVGVSGRRHDDDEGGKMGNGELEEADDEGKYRDAEDKETENGSRWGAGKEGEAVLKERRSSSNSSTSSKLGDALGSNSLQQRLPPTWSDLERMVNMNSKKDLLASREPSLLEQY